MNKQTLKKYLAPIAGFVGASLVVNGLIFGLGWNSEKQPLVQPWFAPPGWAVGLIWVVLFALMGAVYARADIHKKSQIKPGRQRRMLRGLALLCLAYPFYTEGLQASWRGEAGTLLTLLMTAWLAWSLRRYDEKSALLLVPMLAWLSFAAFLTPAVLRLN